MWYNYTTIFGRFLILGIYFAFVMSPNISLHSHISRKLSFWIRIFLYGVYDFPKISAQGLYKQMKAKYFRAPVRPDRAIFMRLTLEVETILVRKKLNDYSV